MIPIQLTLENFLPYRGEVVLDLRTVRVACVSGDNGSGKSSLLDAITWALWGKARGSAERDLISLGATEMAVDFRFLLGNQEFRVLRRRRRRGSSADVAILEAQVRDITPEHDGAWRAITGDTLTQTQRLLTSTLGMEYETFINSAFILQGRADEFTTKGATERKQVLADILGLDQYEQLEAAARGRFRQREAERRDCETQLTYIADEIGKRSEYEEGLIAISRDLIARNQQIIALDGERDRARQRRSELEAMLATIAQAEQRRETHEEQIARVHQSMTTRAERIARLEAVLATADDIEAGYAALKQTEAQEKEWGDLLNPWLKRNEELRQVEQEIRDAQAQRASEIHALEHQITESNQTAARRDSLLEQEQRLNVQLTQLQQRLTRRATLPEQIEQALERRERCRTENERITLDGKKIGQHQQQIAGAEAECPVCRRPLGPDERAHIEAMYQQELQEMRGLYRKHEGEIQQLDRQVNSWRAELSELDRAVRQEGEIAKQLAVLANQLQSASEAAEKARQLEGDRDRLVASTAAGDFAHDARARLADLQHRIAALGYDLESHQRLRGEVESLYPFGERFHELGKARAEIEPLRGQQAADEEQIAAHRQAQAAEVALIDELRPQTVEFDPLNARIEDLDSTRAQIERERDELQGQRGDLEGKLRRLADLEEQADRLRQERARLTEEEGVYRELARAFGKAGIQAMMIEAAIPELEDEANRILGNMPGNSMRVEFRTQRETRKGDLVEALEIVIADEVGQRDYELYSGGEAFRINFAIRVALAKLLARRAGARVQMLVIDEGFGTQDARGRDSLVEAIRSIEDDFETILVITHVNELKDLFPTQILVEKGASGSRITVQ